MCVRCGTGAIAWCTDPGRHGDELTRLERHVNAAEYWLNQADIYDFPSAVRTECLTLASIHAALAQALSLMPRENPGGD